MTALEEQVQVLTLNGYLGRFAGSGSVDRAIAYAKTHKAVAAHPDMIGYGVVFRCHGALCDRVVFKSVDDIPDGWSYYADEDFTD